MTVSTDPSATTDPSAEGPAEGAGPHHPLRFGVGWIAGVLIFGLVVGIAGALLIPRLLLTPGDTSPEAGFLRDMSTHHAQAVEMSMIAHAGTTNPSIVSLANDIALTQQGQKGMMQTWLREWHLDPTGTEKPMAWMPDAQGSVQNGLMPGMATPQQMATLRTAASPALDEQFLTLMRAHHLGGIHMAQGIVDQSDNEDVVWLAQSMIRGQQSELNLIDDLLAKLKTS